MVTLEHMSSRSQLSLRSLYLRLLTSPHQALDDISIVMTIATYSIYCFSVSTASRTNSGEIHLPAYLNDIMNKYKATTRLHYGLSFSILCRKDWLPSTYKVLFLPFADGFMPATYCFLISTTKDLPQSVCDANSHIILTHEINSALCLLIRQHYSLSLPRYMTNLLSSCE